MIGAMQVRQVLAGVLRRTGAETITESEALERVARYWKENTHSWEPEAYGALFFALGNMVRDNPRLRPKALELVNTASENIAIAIQTMSSSELAQVIRGYSSLEPSNPKSLSSLDSLEDRAVLNTWRRTTSITILEAWDNRVVEFWSKMNGFDVVSAIISVGQIKAAHLRCLDELWFVFLEESNRLSAMTLAQVAYSAAILRCNRNDVTERLEFEVKSRLSLVSDHSEVNSRRAVLTGPRAIKLLWAFAILGVPVSQRLANRIIANISKQCFTREGLFALHQSALILGIDLPMALQQHINRALAKHAREHGIVANKWEAEIAEILCSLDLKPIAQYPFDGFYADVALVDPKRSRTILFEFDGPCHALPNGLAVARDLAKEEVALRRGLRLVRISSDQWSGLSGDERTLYIESKVR